MTSIPLKTSDISVIIPALNESASIDPLADTLGTSVGEIILVDGGSTDDTVQKAGTRGFDVIESGPGRAGQMNAGSQRARGQVLLFLHADSLLPAGFSDLIVQALSDKKTLLCSFSLGVDTKNPVLKGIVALANFRSRLLRLPYGDQSFSLKTQDFMELGGFADLPIMEDYELVRKAARRGKIVTLPEQLITSDRRWRKLGVLQTTLINQLVVAGFKCGVPPAKLASLYRKGLFGNN